MIRPARVLVLSMLAALAPCGPPAPRPDLAAPARNRFLKTVVPFLRRIAR